MLRVVTYSLALLVLVAVGRLVVLVVMEALVYEANPFVLHDVCVIETVGHFWDVERHSPWKPGDWMTPAAEAAGQQTP